MKDCEARSRLIDESRELKERTIKLTEFLKSKTYYDLDRRDKRLLIEQEQVMKRYIDILEERLART